MELCQCILVKRKKREKMVKKFGALDLAQKTPAVFLNDRKMGVDIRGHGTCRARWYLGTCIPTC